METTKTKPVTMITGYLGSGKTTVLNELLKSQSDKNLADLQTYRADIPLS